VASKPDKLQRSLNGAMERFGAREILLRYAPGPRWTATALIEHTRMADKLRDDLGLRVCGPSFATTMFEDLPIAQGDGATPIDAVTNMLPVRWRMGPSGHGANRSFKLAYPSE